MLPENTSLNTVVVRFADSLHLSGPSHTQLPLVPSLQRPHFIRHDDKVKAPLLAGLPGACAIDDYYTGFFAMGVSCLFDTGDGIVEDCISWRSGVPV